MPVVNAPPAQPANSYSDSLYVCYYFVLLLDILGQKNELRRWEKLMPGGVAAPEMLQAVRGSLGRVINLKNTFQRISASLEDGVTQSVTRGLIALQTPAGPERERYNALSGAVPKWLHFSDMLVAYAPATIGPSKDWNIAALHRMLGAACGVMPTFLAQATPLRGALCIGGGIEDREVSFYGPALAEAHRLESEVADYPRIVLSRELRDFIRSQPPENTGTANLYVRNGFRLCQQLIGDDTDGETIVDYLGPGAWELVEGKAGLWNDLQRAVREGAQFAINECRRLTQAPAQAAVAPAQPRMSPAEKYARLRVYFESKGVGPETNHVNPTAHR